MSKKKRLNSSLDQFNAHVCVHKSITIGRNNCDYDKFPLYETVNLAIICARITGKTIVIETTPNKPYLQVTPKSTADEVIEQFYKFDSNLTKAYITNAQKGYQEYLLKISRRFKD